MGLQFLLPSLRHYLFPFYHDFKNGVRTFVFNLFIFFVHVKSDNNNSPYTFATLKYKKDMQPKIVV